MTANGPSRQDESILNFNNQNRENPKVQYCDTAPLSHSGYTVFVKPRTKSTFWKNYIVWNQHLMIDWITAKLFCTHKTPISGGKHLEISPDGEVISCWDKKKSVPGSYDSSIRISTASIDENGYGESLRIDGNPVKWFQGHNIFGSDDLIGLVNELMHALVPILDLNPTKNDMESWQVGDYTLSRVDINYSYDLSSLADVQAWIKAAEFTSHTRHGRPSMSSGTIYWGKHSRRWSIKAYAKGQEIKAKGHQLPTELSTSSLRNYAQTKLRLELVLRSLELDKLNLKYTKNWTEKTNTEIYNQYIKRLEISEQMKLTSKQIQALPNRLKPVYIAWNEGYDLKELYSKNTFYRHRKELLKHGINISIAQKTKKQDDTNVVPLVRYLEAIPAQIPDWAYGTKLYFEPRKKIVL